MRTRRTRSAPLAVLAAVVLSAAACSPTASDETSDGGASDGGAEVASLAPDGGPEADDDGEADEGDVEAANAAYMDCMRDEGIELDSAEIEESEARAVGPESDDQGATVNGVEVDEQEFAEAQETCEPLLADVVASRDVDPEQIAEMQDEMLAFSECMREQGVNWPDPTFEEDGIVSMEHDDADPDMPDPNSDEAQAAMEACGHDAAAETGGSTGLNGHDDD